MTKLDPIGQVEAEVSVVIPVFNGEATLELLVEKLIRVLSGASFDFEIIMVDDNSADISWGIIKDLCTTYSFCKGVRLRKNSGQHLATMEGVRRASHDFIVTIDDDLQHPPEKIPELIKALVSPQPELDVVHGIPEDEFQPLARRITSHLGRMVLKKFSGMGHAKKLSSFRAIRRSACEQIVGYRGPNVSLDVLLSWVTDRVGFVTVHFHRTDRTRYTPKRLLNFFLNTFVGYGRRPLKLILVSSLALGFLILVAIIFLSISAVLGGQSPPGYLTLLLAVASFSTLNLLTLGIIGIYVGSISDQTIGRNLLSIIETKGFGNYVSNDETTSTT